MKRLIVLAVAVLLFVPQALLAQHAVSPADLHKDLLNAAQTRQENLQKVQGFLNTEPAQKAIATSKLPASKVQAAVAQLSDAELARLAAQTDKVRQDIAAGALSNQEITYIIIALVTAVVILIIVAA